MDNSNRTALFYTFMTHITFVYQNKIERTIKEVYSTEKNINH